MNGNDYYIPEVVPIDPSSARTVTSSLESIATPNSHYISPNPANQQVRLFVGNGVKGMLTIRIIDMTGRLCKERSAASDDLLIPVDDLSEGLYLLTVCDLQDGILFKEKLLVQRK